MAWSPPALERRSWLVDQAGDYAAPHFPPHPRRHRNRERTLSARTLTCLAAARGRAYLAAFVEAAISAVLSARLSKKQQMRWTSDGAYESDLRALTASLEPRVTPNVRGGSRPAV